MLEVARQQPRNRASEELVQGRAEPVEELGIPKAIGLRGSPEMGRDEEEGMEGKWVMVGTPRPRT